MCWRLGFYSEPFGLRFRVVESANVHEGAFRQIVAFAFSQPVERIDRFLKRCVDALEAGELLVCTPNGWL